MLDQSKFKIIYGGNTKEGERLFYLWEVLGSLSYSLVCKLREGELSKYGIAIIDHGIHHSSPSRYTLGPLSGRLM